MDVPMTISAFCGSRLSRTDNIVQYCQAKSQIKSLDQKGNKQFNTAGNNTQISRAMRASQIIRNGKSRMVYNTTLAAYIQSKTDTQVWLSISGIFYYLTIQRNGITIQSNFATEASLLTQNTSDASDSLRSSSASFNLTISSPGVYLDSGLLANTQYQYDIIPYSTANIAGDVVSLTVITNSNVFAMLDYLAATTVLFTFTGSYRNLVITRNGITIASYITSMAYEDVGLTPNTTYSYAFFSYNDAGQIGQSTNLTITTNSI